MRVELKEESEFVVEYMNLYIEVKPRLRNCPRCLMYLRSRHAVLIRSHACLDVLDVCAM